MPNRDKFTNAFTKYILKRLINLFDTDMHLQGRYRRKQTHSQAASEVNGAVLNFGDTISLDGHFRHGWRCVNRRNVHFAEKYTALIIIEYQLNALCFALLFGQSHLVANIFLTLNARVIRRSYVYADEDNQPYSLFHLHSFYGFFDVFNAF